MKQLMCKDLYPGDIMLKMMNYSGPLGWRVLGGTIQGLEKVAGQSNPQVIHAGVMSDSEKIVEASARGIVKNDLRSDNACYGYSVYRPLDPRLGNGAGTCAEMMSDIHGTQGALRYSPFGAVGSLFPDRGVRKTPGEMDQILDRILSGKKHPFFCSQFVVYVYQFTAAQQKISGIFKDVSDAKVSPSTLASLLTANRRSFYEAGYVMPNER
jgi:hypothetical protein